MRKYCLLIILAVLTQLGTVTAQTLFTAPDTVCVRQPVHLNSTVFGASSYYWGFCSGTVYNAPTGSNLGNGFGFDSPGGIDIQQDVDGKYYGFVVNSATREFLRLNFGTSLANVPTVTNFGSLTDGLPVHPTSLYITYDTAAKEWFVFVTGGFTAAESTVGRIDFGKSLNNPRPNVANFGNLDNNFNGPRGIFVAKDDNGQWYGYLVNRNSNDLVKLNFSYNISITPTTNNLGNIAGVFNLPTDLAAMKDNGEWFLFITNIGSSTVSRVELGHTLDTLTPGGYNLGNFNFRILQPSSISINRDCGDIFAYITDSTTSQLIGIEMSNPRGPYDSVDYGVIAGINMPSSVSKIVRDGDDLYAFVANPGDNSLSRLDISHCTNATIPSFREVTPPVYSYDAPGVYNVYLVIDQGLPTMRVECKLITVLPVPAISITPQISICKGDTVKLWAISNTADSFSWVTDFHIDTAYLHNDTVKAWPPYTTDYHLYISYPFGCLVDTFIRVNVIKVDADAGPDRTIADGATTTLGGPGTSIGSNFVYTWTPSTYLSEVHSPFPVATLSSDYSYVIEVSTLATDGSGLLCKAWDTVTVHINCGDLYLPNAFNPASSNPLANRFGILNKQVTLLNYFRIFDRWGNMVFETTDPTQTWDGTYNGKEEPVGVYVWDADGFCTSGKAVKQHGNVTLVR